MAKTDDELNAAVRDWDKKTRARARINKKAKEMSAEVREAKDEVERLLGERGYDGVKVGSSLISKYDKDRYYVPEAEREEFEAWAADQDEEYLEPNRRVREETLNSNMQQLEEDGQPLPPGVRKYTETKISKRKA